MIIADMFSMANKWAPAKFTNVPGPNSLNLMENAVKVLNHGTISHPLAPFIQAFKHEGLIVDVDGNEYVDCLAAWGSEPYGAGNPRVREAMMNVWDRHGAQISLAVVTPPVIELANKLTELAPDSITRVEFSVSGTQAVESTVRLMRAATGRPIIIVFGPVYHGESTTLTAATSSDMPFVSTGATGFAPGIVHVPYPGVNITAENTGEGFDTIEYLKNWLLKYQISPDQIAGLLIEPVSTEGGALVPSQQFWDDVQELRDQHGWVLAVDEVQTGLGRCGEIFAINMWNNISPDMMILGKGLSGGGMPISAILGSERVMGESDISQGSTFGWQPAACAAAIAGLNELLNGKTLPHVRKLQKTANKTLKPLKKQKHILRVSVVGAEVAVEYDTRIVGDEFIDALHGELLERGVLGIGESAKSFYRLQPPLNIKMYQWEYALEALAELSMNPSLLRG